MKNPLKATLSLSQAVRRGAELVPGEAQRYSHGDGKKTTDVLGAAWAAQFEPGEAPRYLSRPLARLYPQLDKPLSIDAERQAECPIEDPDCRKPRGGKTLQDKILHLQDQHGWGRDKVAAFLEDRGF
jgi:hypothetical protein